MYFFFKSYGNNNWLKFWIDAYENLLTIEDYSDAEASSDCSTLIYFRQFYDFVGFALKLSHLSFLKYRKRSKAS